jgi:GNAT superfamily N-acetyltransferase
MTFDSRGKMIEYVTTLESITPDMLPGFFVGWRNSPSPETHLSILQASQFVVLAIDRRARRVAGFITAVSDGIFSAYVPLLEVLPDYQGRGIGTELVKRMLDQCQDLYMVDTTCDPALQNFYTRCGMHPSTGAMIRNYGKQSGKVEP